MNFDYQAILRDMLLTNNVSDAIGVVQQVEGIEFVTFHLVNSVTAQADNPFVRTNYPAEWVSYYLLNNLVVSDPIVRHAASTEDAFNWSEIPITDADKEFIANSMKFKLGQSGYTIPTSDRTGRRSMLSLNSHADQDTWRNFVTEHSEELVMLARDLHVKGVAEAFAEVGDLPHLSAREYECLKWTSLGKSHTDIAIILDLSEHTVRSYLKTVRLKLDSVTLAQAVAKATQMGLI